MRYSISTARLAGVLAVLLFTSQPALALKLLTEENPPLNYTEGKKLTGMGTEVVQEMGRRAKVKLVYLVREEDSYLACSPRTSPETLKALAGALDGMKKDGSYAKIIKAYESR